MPPFVVLVIYLSATEASNPASQGLLQAARDLLGDQGQVTLRSLPARVSDEALGSGEPGADAVAEVDWLDSDHRRAAVRCYVARLQRVGKREVSFDEGADLYERERMLGFVVAAMLPVQAEPAAAASRVARTPPALPGVQPAAQPAPATSRIPAQFLGLAEVVGLAATGIGGTASSFGAALAGRIRLVHALSLRLAGGLRRGEIPIASANSEVEFLSLGLAVEYPTSSNSQFSVGGRSSALLLRHELDHLSSDDITPNRQSRLLAGADAFFESAWHFSSNAGFVVGVGAELAFGHSDVYVKGSRVAEIPPLRGLLELGIQAKF